MTIQKIAIRLTLTLAAVLLMAALISPISAAPKSVSAQGPTTSDRVLAAFSNYIGINPVLTAAELEFEGAEERRFPVSFRFTGLDLRTGGLSCDSRVMAADERIVGGEVGFRYLITLNGLTYELRTNFFGTRIIRCFFGEEIDFDPLPRGIGPSITGEEATRVAMRHLSGYLQLERPITIEEADEPLEDSPRVFYRWSAPVVFGDASLGCPLRGATYDVRDTLGWRVTLTVNGRVYPYRVRMDGNVVLLCFGGRPDPSSIGLPAVAAEE